MIVYCSLCDWEWDSVPDNDLAIAHNLLATHHNREHGRELRTMSDNLTKCQTCAALIVEDDLGQHQLWHQLINRVMSDHYHNQSGEAVIRK